MKSENRIGNLTYWSGLVLALVATVAMGLNFTAMAALLDMPGIALAIALLSALLLFVATWRNSKRATPRRSRRNVGIIALLVLLGVVVWSVDMRFLSYRSAEIRFDNDDTRLAGTVYSPRSTGRHPAVVLVHGSGPETRREYAFYAKMLARNGIVGLAYDKRGAGQSTGKLYESDYGDYAHDVLEALSVLANRDDVDPRCIGLVGFSEGEWVAPLAATQSSSVAFLVVTAPSGVSPARQVNQEIARRLRDRGYPEESVSLALALNDRVFAYQRTGEGRDALQRDLQVAKSQPWFADADDIPEQLYPVEEYAWWRSVMDFDPAPVWEQVKSPVLLLKGGRDQKSDPAIARREIQSALQKGGNKQLQFVVFPEADHSMLNWPFGRTVPVFADGYLDTMVRWVRRQDCASSSPH